MPVTGQSLIVSAVAKALCCDIDSVYVLIASGQLPAFNIATNPKAKRKSWRILDADLQAFIARRSSRPSPAPAVRKPRASKASGNVIEFFR
jgi:Helix-turn-helix domain